MMQTVNKVKYMDFYFDTCMLVNYVKLTLNCVPTYSMCLLGNDLTAYKREPLLNSTKTKCTRREFRNTKSIYSNKFRTQAQ